MQVILLDSIPNLGDRGALVNVKSGFARNYLFPKQLALPASQANERVFHERQRVMVKRDELARDAARTFASGLADVSCTIPVQVGEEDKLYGSVTNADIAKSLVDLGHDIDRKQIVLEEPIKQLGVYTVDVKLHREVAAPIKVWVVKE